MTEIDVYQQLARHMKANYPRVLFHFDLSGVHNPSPATRALYSRLNSRAFPDLFVAVPCILPDGTTRGGLFLELKRPGTRLKKVNGRWANQHIAEQAAALELLAAVGYVAEFAVGLESAVQIIDSYLVPIWSLDGTQSPSSGESEGF